MILTSKGFSLIECMIAMVILSVGVLAVCSMSITAAKSNYKSRNLITAVTLAQNTLNELRPEVDSLSGENEFIETALDEHGNGNYSRNVMVTGMADFGYTLIEVEVTWNDPEPGSIILKTMMAD